MHNYHIFRKNKVLPQLQSCFVDFIFNCLVISPPEKAELAEEMAGRDFLDFSVSFNPIEHENIYLLATL